MVLWLHSLLISFWMRLMAHLACSAHFYTFNGGRQPPHKPTIRKHFSRLWSIDDPQLWVCITLTYAISDKHNQHNAQLHDRHLDTLYYFRLSYVFTVFSFDGHSDEFKFKGILFWLTPNGANNTNIYTLRENETTINQECFQVHTTSVLILKWHHWTHWTFSKCQHLIYMRWCRIHSISISYTYAQVHHQ